MSVSIILGNIVILLWRIAVKLVIVESMMDSWLLCMKFYNINVGKCFILLFLFFAAIFQSHCESYDREAKLFIFRDLIIGKVLFIFIYPIFFPFETF